LVGNVQVNVGPVTLRLTPSVMQALLATLQEADARYRALEARHKQHDPFSRLVLPSSKLPSRGSA
jgi:hypothetical protein